MQDGGNLSINPTTTKGLNDLHTKIYLYSTYSLVVTIVSFIPKRQFQYGTEACKYELMGEQLLDQ